MKNFIKNFTITLTLSSLFSSTAFLYAMDNTSNQNDASFRTPPRTSRAGNATTYHQACDEEHKESVEHIDSLSFQDRRNYPSYQRHEAQLLHTVIEQQSELIPSVEYLLKKNADITLVDQNNQTVLHKAAEKGYVATAKLLLQADAFRITANARYRSLVYIKDSRGMTPLMIAAKHGHLEVVREICTYKEQMIYLEQKDNEGNTALAHASLQDNIEIVKLLLARNANALSRNKHNKSPLEHAISRQFEIAKYLLLKASAFELANSDDTTLQVLYNTLLIVAGKGDENNTIITLLLQKITELYQKLAYENTGNPAELADNRNYIFQLNKMRNRCIASALDYALENNHTQTTQVLFEHVKNNKHLLCQTTELYLLRTAAKMGHEEIVRILVNRGIKVDAEHNTKKGSKTALMLAAENGHHDIVRFLLIIGKADPLLRDRNGDTALTLATREDKINCVSQLMDYVTAKYDTPTTSSFINHRNATGITALQQSIVSHKSNEIALILLEAAQKGLYTLKHKDAIIALHCAAYHGHIPVIEKLVELGVPIDSPDLEPNIDSLDPEPNKCTILMSSALTENIDQVKALLALKASVETKDANGHSALTYAAQNNNRKITDILLSAHADKDHAIDTGETALMIATQEGNTEPLCALLEARADVHLQNKHGDSALSLAVIENEKEPVRLLILGGADPHLPNTIDNSVPWHDASDEMKRIMEDAVLERESALHTAKELAMHMHVDSRAEDDSLPRLDSGIARTICEYTEPFKRQNPHKHRRSSTDSSESPDAHHDVTITNKRHRRGSIFKTVCCAGNTQIHACSICNKSLAQTTQCAACTFVNDSLQSSCILCTAQLKP